MATSPFPARKSQGAGGMTSTGPGAAGPLDGPPPSPAMQGAQPPVPGMTGDRWTRLWEAFHDALERPPAERQVTAAKAGRGDGRGDRVVHRA